MESLTVARRIGELRDRLDGTVAGLDPVEVMRTRLPLLAYLKDADFNSTADQQLSSLPARYIIRRIVVANPSISLTTAAGGIYAAPSKGGTAIVAAAQVYSALTGVSKFLDLTLAAVCGTDWFVEASIYLSLTTAQGADARADLYIFGDQLP